MKRTGWIRTARMAWALGLAILTSNEAAADWFVARTNTHNVYMSQQNGCSPLLGFVPAGGLTPTTLAVNPAGTRLYVKTGDAVTINITAIDTTTRAGTPFLTGSPIYAMAASNTRFYTVGGAGLLVYDAVSKARVAQVFMPGTPTKLAVNHAATRVYVVVGSSVVVVDAATNSIITSVTAAGTIGDIVVSNDDNRAYVTTFDAQTLDVIDLAGNTVIRSTPLGYPADILKMNPAGTRLYAMVPFSNSLPRDARLLAIDPATGAVNAERRLDNSSIDVTVEGDFVLVSQYNSVEPPGSEQSAFGLIVFIEPNGLGTQHEFRVGGRPWGLASWQPPPPPPPPPGVEITGIEVTQGIQDLDNSVRLVERKRSVARVYVKRAPGFTSQPLTMYLYGIRSSCTMTGCGSGYLGSIIPSNAAGPLLVVPEAPRRKRIGDSFYFTLPWEWTNTTELRLHAVLGRPGEPAPACNINAPYETVGFDIGTELHMKFVRMQYTYSGLQTATANDQNKAESYIKRLYPLSKLVATDMYFRDEKLMSHVLRLSDFCLDEPVDKRNECAGKHVRLLLGAMQVTGALDVIGNADGAYAMIPQIPASLDPTGQYFTRGACCTARIASGASNSPSTAAHEIGHMLGRQHPNEGADLCKHEGNDPNYPYPLSAIHPLFPYDPERGLAGFDIGDPLMNIGRRAIGPDAFYDLMGYCSFEWISDYTWDGLYLALRALNPGDGRYKARAPLPARAATPQPGDWLIVSGVFETDVTRPVMLETRRVDRIMNLPARPAGTHAIRLLDSGGTVLAEYSFAPERSGETGSSEFVHAVPYVAGTRQIRIVEMAGNRTIVTRAVSAGSPAVTNVTAGTVTAAHVPLSWSASDPDGDPLSYDIFASRDAGATWLALVSGASAMTADVDVSTLGGGSTMLRVQASDGVLTAHAESAPFTLPNKAPDVTIVDPADADGLFAGQVLNLEGFANDAQDGPLNGASLVWSIPGRTLGTSARVTVMDLPVGANAITFTATNSLGLSASKTVNVTISSPPAVLGPVLTAGPSSAGWQVAAGETTTQTRVLEIGNSGTGTVQFTAQSDASWLTLSSPSGVAPMSLTLSANPTGLARGTRRRAIVTLTAVGLPDQVIRVPVQLAVGDTFNTPEFAAASPPPPPPLPVPNAGTDQTVTEANPVTLNGSATTVAAGHTATYQWTQTQGTSVALAGATTLNATFTAPRPNGATEALRFELAVTDDANQRAVDEVTITVNALPAPPPPPPAKKGGGSMEAWSLLALLALALWRLGARRPRSKPRRIRAPARPYFRG